MLEQTLIGEKPVLGHGSRSTSDITRPVEKNVQLRLIAYMYRTYLRAMRHRSSLFPHFSLITSQDCLQCLSDDTFPSQTTSDLSQPDQNHLPPTSPV